MLVRYSLVYINKKWNNLTLNRGKHLYFPALAELVLNHLKINCLRKIYIFFIVEVALFAKKHSQYAAAKIFNVARRRIFDWMRQIPKETHTNNLKRNKSFRAFHPSITWTIIH